MVLTKEMFVNNSNSENEIKKTTPGQLDIGMFRQRPPEEKKVPEVDNFGRVLDSAKGVAVEAWEIMKVSAREAIRDETPIGFFMKPVEELAPKERQRVYELKVELAKEGLMPETIATKMLIDTVELPLKKLGEGIRYITTPVRTGVKTLSLKLGMDEKMAEGVSETIGWVSEMAAYIAISRKIPKVAQAVKGVAQQPARVRHNRMYDFLRNKSIAKAQRTQNVDRATAERMVDDMSGGKFGRATYNVVQQLTEQEMAKIDTTKMTQKAFKDVGKRVNARIKANPDAIISKIKAEVKRPIDAKTPFGKTVEALPATPKPKEIGPKFVLDKETGKPLEIAPPSSSEEALEFEQAEQAYLDSLPVPPSVDDLPPGETVSEVLEQTPKYKKPSYPTTLITAQNRTAELLGLKKIVEPLEIGKLNLEKEWIARAKDVKKVVSQVKELGPEVEKELAVALNTSEVAPKNLSEKAKAAFDYFRNMTREILDRTNAVREATGRKPIEGISGYFRHVAKDAVQDYLDGKYPIPEDAKFFSQINMSKEIRNPMEMKRKLEDDLLKYFSSDVNKAMTAMLRTGLKEIHLAIPKFLAQGELEVKVLPKEVFEGMTPEQQKEYTAKRNLMPAETRQWLIDYVNVIIEGEQTALDRGVNNTVNATALKPALEAILKPFGKLLSGRPITDMILSVSRLPILGTLGGINPRQLIRNKFQLLQSFAIYGVGPTVQGVLPVAKGSTLEELKTDNLFLDTYRGYENVDSKIRSKVEKAMLAPFQWTAITNASQAMNAAFYWTKSLIVNPRHRKLGWADPQRTGTEDFDFFYPSEKQKLRKEMEYGAQTTQYQYLAMGMPEIFRYKSLAGATRLLSWPMNYWMLFTREYATRALTGHTGYDENLKIPTSARFNALQYLILAGTILNTMGYTRSFLFGTAPTGMPPTAQLVMGLYSYFTTKGGSDYAKRKRGEALRDIKSAVLTFIPGYLSIKDGKAFLSGEKSLSEYLFYKKKAASSGGWKK